MTSTVEEHSARSPLQWSFSQAFGQHFPGEVQNADIVSAIEFEKKGDYLAVGDRGGRIVLFERRDGENSTNQQYSRSQLEELDYSYPRHPEYIYRTEFQSHEPEFDYLKSVEIEEKINKIKWCMPNRSSFLLSTNDKTIKLWKVKEHKAKKNKELNPYPAVGSENALLAERSFLSEHDVQSFVNGNHPEWKENVSDNVLPHQGMSTKIADDEDGACARCRRVYSHAHDFNINSISNNSDGETFISADDLRINLWNLEVSNQCFNIIDMKPSNMEDLIEVITSAEFHPSQCNLLAYSTTRGFLRIVDMRKSALCDNGARMLQDPETPASRTFFTELVTAISDIKFLNDGRHILSRDYMNLKLWDLHMDSRPVSTFKVHEHLRPKFSELYNSDAIFDKFECFASGDGLHFATGSYSNLLRIFSPGIGNEDGISMEAGKNPHRRVTFGVGVQGERLKRLTCKNPLLQSTSRARRSSISSIARGFYKQVHEGVGYGGNEFPYDLSSKLIHLAWHPTENIIACASKSSLFLYHA